MKQSLLLFLIIAFCSQSCDTNNNYIPDVYVQFQIPLTEKGDYTQRGTVLFYVFKDDSAEYVRIDAGYPYDPNKYVKVAIDGNNYQFFGENDSAWSMKDDRIIIDAMKAGKGMTVVGYSQRGTETTDTYTLIGFTKAYEALQNDC